MAGIEMVEFSLEPSSLPPTLSPVLAKPDISLHQVVEKGWVRAVREIAVREPLLLNEKDNHGCTPLHYAAAKNYWEIVDFLMNQEGTDVDTADKDGCTPLLVAAREGSTEAFAKLLERADLEKTENKGRNAVLFAAEADHSAILKAAKDKYPDFLKQLKSDEVTPLQAAAASGSENSLKVLLEQRVDVNARNKWQQRTPLHLAARNGHNGVVKMLLAYYEPPSDVETDELLATVDISAGDYCSNTALHLAAEGGHCSVADTLLSKGASIRARNEDNQTPLHLAARGGHQEMVELLVSKHHAEVDARDKQDRTPLHWAAVTGHSDVVTTLLQHKADLTAVSADLGGRNALEIAIDRGKDDVAMAIVKHDKWRSAMRHTHLLNRGMNQQTTPMRELIKKMPEVAREVLNKCTEEHGEDPRSCDYEVEYDYEFFDDLRDPVVSVKDDPNMYVMLEPTDHEADRSPEETDSKANVSPYQRKWSYRPSLLLKRLEPKFLRSRIRSESLYTSWGPTGFNAANHPLMLMVENKRTELLNHPLVSSLVAYKWKRAWPLYLANVLFYLVFLSFFTAYALVLPNPQSELCVAVSNHMFANASVECGNGSNATAILCGECSANQPFLYAAGVVVVLCVVIRVIMEFIQFLEQPRGHFLNRENRLEVFLYTFTLIFMSSLGRTCECPKPWQWQIGALAVFQAWIQLGLLGRKIPQLGLYNIIFEGIVITFLKIAIPAMLLLLAFSFAFYMMFFVPSPLFAASAFATPGLSIIKAMTMSDGEMDFEAVFRLRSDGVSDIDEVPTPIPYAGVSILLWIFFLIIMPILLMNMLTGLAVGDVDLIQSDAENRKLALQIDLVMMTERAFQVIRTWFMAPYKRRTEAPNKHCQRKRFLSLLAGVDTSLTGEDIHKSLSKPVKHIEIEHVHEQTIALLAKLEKQGAEQREEAAKLSSEQRNEMGELKTALTDQINEVKAELTTAMADMRSEQWTEGDLKTALAVQVKTDLSAEMVEQKAEVAAMRAAMAEQRAMMEKLLELCSAGGREERRASPTQD